MGRKLVKHGEATLMVSLPSKWLRANNLGKGDEIEVTEKDKELTISSKATAKKKKEKIIEINNENKHDIYPILTHAYRKGFDKIILKGLINAIAKQVKSITNNLLLGFEVTEKTDKEIVIENISEPTENKYEVILKKVFMIIKDTNEFLLEDLKASKFNMLEMQENRDLGDKFILFCRRILNKSRSDIALDWEFLTFLMHIEHVYYYLYRYIVKNKVKSEKPMLDLIKELGKYFNLLEKAYNDKDLNDIHKINNLKDKFQFGKCLELLSKSKGKETVVYSYIGEIFRLIQIGTSPILSEILEE